VTVAGISYEKSLLIKILGYRATIREMTQIERQSLADTKKEREEDFPRRVWVS